MAQLLGLALTVKPAEVLQIPVLTDISRPIALNLVEEEEHAG